MDEAQKPVIEAGTDRVVLNGRGAALHRAVEGAEPVKILLAVGAMQGGLQRRKEIPSATLSLLG